MTPLDPIVQDSTPTIIARRLRAAVASGEFRPGQQLTSPRPAFGDHTGSIALAYGIAGALFKRAMTGEPSVVENSLLATACWVLSGDLTQVQLPQYETHPQQRPIMPLMQLYQTRDGRQVQLMVLQPQPRWAALSPLMIPKTFARP